MDGQVHFWFDLNLYRLRTDPFEGPANGKPPALPEVHDYRGRIWEKKILEEVTSYSSFKFKKAGSEMALLFLRRKPGPRNRARRPN